MSNEYCTYEKRETKDMTTLDKIKAEVADKSYLSYDGNPRHIIDESWVFEIIDKYAEQEDMTTLDKIRAEIEQNAYPIVHGVNNHEKGMTLYGILQVIDKYKNLPKRESVGMSKEEKALALEYLYEIQKNYVEGVGYEEHPLPEWYALESAIKALECRS